MPITAGMMSWADDTLPNALLASWIWALRLLAVAGSVEGRGRPVGLELLHENQEGQRAWRPTSIHDSRQWKQESCTLNWRTCKIDTICQMFQGFMSITRPSVK